MQGHLKTKSLSLDNPYLSLLAILGMVILLIMIWFSPQNPAYDERYFQPNCLLFDNTGLSETFLLQMKNQAPGPLYQMVHYLGKGITAYQFPKMRFFNLGLFIATLLTMVAVLKKLKSDAYLLPLILLFVPVIWPIAGMALTEMPAICTAMLGCYFLMSLVNVEEHTSSTIVKALACGLFLGLSIMGRTTFLIFFPVLLFAMVRFNNNKTRLYLAISMVVMALVALPQFVVWHSLVPRDQQVTNQGGIKPQFLFLSISYTAMFALIIDLNFVWVSRKTLWIILAATGLFATINILTGFIEYEILKYIINRLDQPWLQQIFPRLVPCVFFFISACFCVNYIPIVWKDFYTDRIVFHAIAGLLILTSLKISHQFSARYSSIAIPFLLLGLYPNIKLSLRSYPIWIFTIGLGCISLHSFLIKI